MGAWGQNLENDLVTIPQHGAEGRRDGLTHSPHPRHALPQTQQMSLAGLSFCLAWLDPVFFLQRNPSPVEVETGHFLSFVSPAPLGVAGME